MGIRLFESLEARNLLAATLVSDFNTSPQSGNPQHLTELQDHAYFFSSANGSVPRPFGSIVTQLWRTNGEPTGTELVFEFDTSSQVPSPPIVRDSELFFVLDGAIWKSDGTSAGTQVVADGLSLSDRSEMALRGREVFVWTPNSRELWVTSGEAATTRQLLSRFDGGEIELPGILNRLEPAITSLFVYRDEVYFTANDGSGRTLWKSDGSIEGTTKLTSSREFGLGADWPEIGGVVDDLLVFENGNDLWTTDGTEKGTTRLFEGQDRIRVGKLTTSGESSTMTQTVVEGYFYFGGIDSEHGHELWRTDGTPGGTELVADLNPGPDSSGVNDVFASAGGLFVIGYDGVWFVEENTTVRQVFSGDIVTPALTTPRLIDDALIFTAKSDGEYVRWLTDGTIQGTQPLLESRLKSLETAGTILEHQGSILARLESEFGRELFSTDGETTQLVVDARPGTLGSAPRIEGIANGLLVEHEEGDTSRLSQINLDGTETHFDLLASGFTATESNNPDVVFFTTYSNDTNDLWKLQAGKLVRLPVHGVSHITAMGEHGAVFLRGVSRSHERTEIWYTDGTIDGTVVLGETELNASVGLAVVDETIFFLRDGEADFELWKLEIAGPPEFVANLGATAVGSPASRLTSHDGGILTVIGRRRDYKLWSSDGSPTGTQIIGQFESTDKMFEFNGAVYFSGRTEKSRPALWRTDGTIEGTVLVSNIDVASTSYFGDSPITSPVVAIAEDQIFLGADDGKHGVELWVSDGTTEGTRLVSDLTPGPEDSFFGSLTANRNQAYFFGNTADGLGLWTSDGTALGTYSMIEDVWPFQLTPVADRLYFTRIDPLVGHELFSTPISQHNLIGDIDRNGVVDFEDFLVLSANFGGEDVEHLQGDLNGNSQVEFDDFLLLSANFGRRLEPPVDALVVDEIFKLEG